MLLSAPLDIAHHGTQSRCRPGRATLFIAVLKPCNLFVCGTGGRPCRWCPIFGGRPSRGCIDSSPIESLGGGRPKCRTHPQRPHRRQGCGHLPNGERCECDNRCRRPGCKSSAHRAASNRMPFEEARIGIHPKGYVSRFDQRKRGM
jgi:hypothetical protein